MNEYHIATSEFPTHVIIYCERPLRWDLTKRRYHESGLSYPRKDLSEMFPAFNAPVHGSEDVVVMRMQGNGRRTEDHIYQKEL